MEVSLENVKMLEGAREMMTREASIFLEADYNLFIDREDAAQRVHRPFENRLDEIKSRIFEHIPEDTAKVIDALIFDYLDMLSSAMNEQTGAAFYAGWLFGAGQRDAALKVIDAVPEVIENYLHDSMDHSIDVRSEQVSRLEVSSVVPLGVVRGDGEV